MQEMEAQGDQVLAQQPQQEVSDSEPTQPYIEEAEIDESLPVATLIQRLQSRSQASRALAPFRSQQ